MPTVIRGDQVTLKFDTVDYTMDAKSVLITGEEDSDATTFAGRAYKYSMVISGLQSDDPESLYDLFWAERGTIVPFTVKSTATGRAITGSVRLSDKLPDWGGDAFSAWNFDQELELIGEPVRAAATP